MWIIDFLHVSTGKRCSYLVAKHWRSSIFPWKWARKAAQTGWNRKRKQLHLRLFIGALFIKDFPSNLLQPPLPVTVNSPPTHYTLLPVCSAESVVARRHHHHRPKQGRWMTDRPFSVHPSIRSPFMFLLATMSLFFSHVALDPQHVVVARALSGVIQADSVKHIHGNRLPPACQWVEGSRDREGVLKSNEGGAVQ